MASINIAELFARISAEQKAKIQSAEQLHSRNYEWLNDIKESAKQLFKKEAKQPEEPSQEQCEVTGSNNEVTELDDTGHSDMFVLLPKTPREKKARATRIKDVEKQSTGRPCYATNRSARAASRAAQSRIRSNLTEKLNKKKRRPTEIKNKSNNSEYTTSITEGDSVNSMEECTMQTLIRSNGHSTTSEQQNTSPETVIKVLSHTVGESTISEDGLSTPICNNKEKTSVDSGKSVHFQNVEHIDSRYIANEDNPTSSKSERSRSSCNKLLTNKSNDENQIAKISPVQLITEITDNPNKDINASDSNNDQSDQSLRNSPTKQKQEVDSAEMEEHQPSLSNEDNTHSKSENSAQHSISTDETSTTQSPSRESPKSAEVEKHQLPLISEDKTHSQLENSAQHSTSTGETSTIQSPSEEVSELKNMEIRSSTSSTVSGVTSIQSLNVVPIPHPPSSQITSNNLNQKETSENSTSTAAIEIALRVTRSCSKNQMLDESSKAEDPENAPRRSARNKAKERSPSSGSNSKKIKITAPTPSPHRSNDNNHMKIKLTHPSKGTPSLTTSSVSTPNLMSGKSIAMFSSKYPSKAKNMLHSSNKGGKMCSTTSLITAAKGASSSMKQSSTRKITPRSPLKETNATNAALGHFGSGGQKYRPGSNSSATGFNKIRSRLGNVTKSPLLTSATKSGTITSKITSFLPQKAPKIPKLTVEEIHVKKQEELNQKKAKENEAARKREEEAKARQEEKRRKNEDKQKKVREAREAKEKQKAQEREKLEKENKERQDAIIKSRMMLEQKRRNEQEERCKREAEQERIRIEEEKAKKLEEEQNKKRKQEAELEKKRQALELQKQEDVQMQEHMKQQQIKDSMRAKLNETYNAEEKPGPESATNRPPENPNSTFTKENVKPTKLANATVTSYDITPARHELPPEELVDEDNYDIGDLRSDEDTDDEDAPRKEIPKWAQGSLFKTALITQAYRKEGFVDLIFFVQDSSPDLDDIFSGDRYEKKRRFYKRTSSAVWKAAPKSHRYDKDY